MLTGCWEHTGIQEKIRFLSRGIRVLENAVVRLFALVGIWGSMLHSGG
jgi:hypothetical protein